MSFDHTCAQSGAEQRTRGDRSTPAAPAPRSDATAAPAPAGLPLYLQRLATGQPTPAAAAPALQQLDALLDRFDVPEEEVLALLRTFGTTDKLTVLSGYRDRLALVLNTEEMVQAVSILGPDLGTKLEWVFAAAMFGSSVAYPEVRDLITRATVQEREALKTEAMRRCFATLCGTEHMKEALGDLGFDTPTRIRWLLAAGLVPEAFQLFIALSQAEFDTTTAAMTQEDTVALLAGISERERTAHADLVERIKVARVMATGDSMVGQLRWRGGSGPVPQLGFQIRKLTSWGHVNDFATWIRGDGPEPTSTGTMICWEAVMFIAYKAGIVSKDWLVKIHTEAAAQGVAASDRAKADPLRKKTPNRAGFDAYYSVIERNLYRGASRTPAPYDKSTRLRVADIPAGNVVFIGQSPNHMVNHVVLAKGTLDGMGRHRVLSLWIVPDRMPPGAIDPANTYGVLQETTIEQIAQSYPGSTTADVEFAPPPW